MKIMSSFGQLAKWRNNKQNMMQMNIIAENFFVIQSFYIKKNKNLLYLLYKKI